MNRVTHIILNYILLILLSMLVGCVGMYMPTAPNVPLITEEGESEIAMGTSVNDFSIKGSHAITEKLALMGGVNFSYGTILKYDNLFDVLDEKETGIVNNESTYKAWQIEFAFGRYTDLGNKWLYEIYGGINYGNTQSETNQTLNYSSIFLQNNFGIKQNEHFEVGFSWKPSYNYFNYDEFHLSGLHSNTVFCGITNQISLVLKLGGENLKVMFSPGLTYTYLFNDYEYNEYGFAPKDFSSRYHLAVGLCYGF